MFWRRTPLSPLAVVAGAFGVNLGVWRETCNDALRHTLDKASKKVKSIVVRQARENPLKAVQKDVQSMTKIIGIQRITL